MSTSNPENQNALPSFDNEMAEIVESFIVESNEILDKLGQNLMDLEKTPTDAELHNVIFRAVHTLKGTSSFLGFEQMTGLSHKFEDVLNKIRKGELQVTSDKMDVMFEGYDLLKELLRRIETKDGTPVDIHDVAAKLEAIAQGKTVESSRKVNAAPAVVAPVEPEKEEAVVVEEPTDSAKPPAEDPAMKAADGPVGQTAQVQLAKAADTSIRVDVARLDSLMDLVGELVLGRNRLSQITHQMNEHEEGFAAVRELAETNSHIDFITTELQMAVMKTRMLPIAKVFNKLPRLIREVSKEMGKEIDLIVVGEETELDKTLIEELNDPMVHLLRNAGDHGVECPQDRIAAGKPARGTVTVRAEHEGNHIVISVQDDGKGMDPDKLRQKAIEKGLTTEALARELSTKEIFNFVFAPGFSTAQKVTNVSGRGVGMDVVKTNILKLKGTIDIESELNKGSKFIIKLPLTLAIIQALLVEVNKEVFSIPLDSVHEVVRVGQQELSTINGREVIRLRNSVLPLARLSEIFGMRQNGNGKRGGEMYVVVVGLAEQRLGIVVDSLLGQKEVVIKSLGDYLGNVRGIAGSTILGDGRVIMIVDVGELMKLCATIA
ncbi:MAG: chemotaxis protein CheA [Ignavibacteriales bacterium]|nr:chemotaxis protein CheA [Ignavibacteriales bacterium]